MNYLKQAFRKFSTNEKGTAGIELVFLMPFMVLWILGSIAFFDAFKTYLTSNKATYTVIDLVSRLGGGAETVNDQQIEVITSIFDNIVDADGSAPQVVISSIVKRSDGTHDVSWSVASNGASKLTAANIPMDYIPIFPAGQSVLLIESHVPFIARKAWGGLTDRTFENKLAVIPRYATVLVNDDQPYTDPTLSNGSGDGGDGSGNG